MMWELAEFLVETPLVDLAFWIGATGLSQWIQLTFWVIPTTQTIHILAIAAVFGSVFMINLRILELAGRERTMTEVARRYLPWVWWGLLVLLLSGLVLIIGEPMRELISPAFWIKMVLILIAIAVSVWFQASVRKNMAIWETSHPKRVAVRVAAVAVIVLWCAIIVFGRWIAYAPTAL